MELSKNSIVPVGFHPKVHATVVWDNNDFMEETISGTGTTNNTKGIIVQQISTDIQNVVEQSMIMKKLENIPFSHHLRTC